MAVLWDSLALFPTNKSTSEPGIKVGVPVVSYIAKLSWSFPPDANLTEMVAPQWQALVRLPVYVNSPIVVVVSTVNPVACLAVPPPRLTGTQVSAVDMVVVLSLS